MPQPIHRRPCTVSVAASPPEEVAVPTRGPTGKQVAVRANVSQSTVSLVLSGRATGRVSSRTQAAVEAAARDLGYRPHAAARSLRIGRTGLVLLLLPDLRNPFNARVLDGAQSIAEAVGRAVVLGADLGGAVLERMPTAVDGVLTCGVDVPAGGGTPGMPTVVMEAAGGRGAVRVTLGSPAGMTRAVEHLVALGHRRIGYLRAAGGGAASVPRVRAFRRATGGAQTVERIAHPCVADSERVAVELLSVPVPVTALICDDDRQAAAVYRAAGRLGVGVPAQLSVVAFGNTPAAGLLYPDLTTVQTDGRDLGRVGMQMLLELIGGGRPPMRVRLRAPLVHGRSTATPGPTHPV
jgi:LacI family transcriptional regulator, repressor for deo operon, udp, cdd, tsx, nupC, and nupG